MGARFVGMFESCCTIFGGTTMEGGDEVPIYDFICENCGPFELRRSFAEAGEQAVCPSCEEEAKRVYSMPNTRSMSTGLSKAMNRAEKSAHEPEVVSRPAGGAPSQGHNHGRPWSLGH